MKTNTPKAKIRKFTLLVMFSLLVPHLGACSGDADDSRVTAEAGGKQGVALSPDTPGATAVETSDLVATVEDERITFSLLNTMMNSSAMVGLSLPALGTPQRHEAIITLLDKVISANLLYVDAKANGEDQQPQYLQDVQRYEDANIGSLYKSKVMIGEIPVTDAEVEAFYKSDIKQDVELTDDVKLAIEAKLRKQKLQELKSSMRQRLREGVSIEIDTDKLKVANTVDRKDEDVIVRVDDDTMTWGDIKMAMGGADRKEELAPFTVDSETERMTRLQSLIDEHILVTRGRAAGVENDPDFMRRAAEYRKTRLINLYRSKLIQGWQPTDEQLQAYFEEHRDSISVPESRKVQMVVVETREEAEAVKARIENGEITMYQAAQEYSLDPNAKQTLGEIGWVDRGSGFPELDEVAFMLEPDEIGGPVQSPAGWHLVRVLDVRDAQLQFLSDPQTRKVTLRQYLKDKQAAYVVDLRLNKYTVKVDDENLHRLFQQEADWIAALTEKSKQEGSITQERVKAMDKWMTK